MLSKLKKKIFAILIASLIIIGCTYPSYNSVEAVPPEYNDQFASHLKKDKWVYNPKNFKVDKKQRLDQNIIALFYPNMNGETSAIYRVIRGITLGVMIIFIVIAGGSLLLNKKADESKKHLSSLLYIMLGGVFIYAANRLFGDVLNFNMSGDRFTLSEGDGNIGNYTNALIGQGSVAFVILSAIKAFAFFLAIIMIVVTGFKVMSAGEGEKGKKLVKGLVNVVVALLIIKGIDFIYYLTSDSSSFITNASDFIINAAIAFAWIYGVIVFLMVLVAGYLYITDGGDGASFKKASNIMINILLSALVLFGFLLITYQIFAEFQTGGDAVTNVEQETEQVPENPEAYIITNQNYV